MLTSVPTALSARVEIAAYSIQRRVLHGGYHHRRGENRRQRSILKLVGKVRRRDAQCVGSLGSDRNRTHGTNSRFGAHD
jgi:hypothetical protein